MPLLEHIRRFENGVIRNYEQGLMTVVAVCVLVIIMMSLLRRHDAKCGRFEYRIRPGAASKVALSLLLFEVTVTLVRLAYLDVSPPGVLTAYLFGLGVAFGVLIALCRNLRSTLTQHPDNLPSVTVFTIQGGPVLWSVHFKVAWRLTIPYVLNREWRKWFGPRQSGDSSPFAFGDKRKLHRKLEVLTSQLLRDLSDKPGAVVVLASPLFTRNPRVLRHFIEEHVMALESKWCHIEVSQKLPWVEWALGDALFQWAPRDAPTYAKRRAVGVLLWRKGDSRPVLPVSFRSLRSCEVDLPAPGSPQHARDAA